MQVRLTNEVREYLTNVSRDFPLEQVWELFNMQYPYMTKNRSIGYLEKLLEENKIEYFRKGDLGIFTLREANIIYNLTKICKNINEIYSAYNQQYPNRCDFEKFDKESNKLECIKEFKEKYGKSDKMNMFEISFISDSIKNKDTEEETYQKYKDRFKNSVTFKDFHSHYSVIKNHKEEGKGKPPINFTDSDVELLYKLANGNRNKSQLYNEFSNISSTKMSKATFDRKIKDLDLNITDGRDKSKKKEKLNSIDGRSNRIDYSNEFIEDLTNLYNKNSLNKCIEIMKTWNKYNDILSKDNLHSRLSKFLSQRGIKKGDSSKEVILKDTKENVNCEELDIDNIIKELAKDHTVSETFDIVVNDYNFTKYCNVNSFNSKYSKLVNFKVYDKITDEDTKVIIDVINSGYVGRAASSEVSRRLPHKYRTNIILKAISDIKSELKSKPEINTIHIHGITKPDTIIQVNDTSVNNQTEVEQSIAWHGSDKFQPIINEVNSVFEDRCRKLNVPTKAEDSTDKLIEALKVLLEYTEDTKEVIKVCTDQEDIIEQYRREIDHEIENLPFSETDTTAQNKIKVLRMKRRGIKNTKENSDIINPIANIIQHNASKFKQVLAALEKKKEERDNFIFIPLVDTTMIEKYEWCKSGGFGSVRANTPILTTHKKEMKEEAKKKNSNIKKFRVQAEYMAWDGKPFHSMYYDIYAVSTEKAIENSKNFFDDLSRKHNNSRYTIKDAYQLNT